MLEFLFVERKMLDMEMIDLVQEYRNKLEQNPHDISCLLFALQIPSVCSRIDFPQTPENTGRCEDGKLYRPNGNPWDANMYKAWLRRHHSHFENIYNSSMTIDAFCENLYNLRNQVTHEGVLMSDKNKFYFIESDNAMSIRDIVFIPIKRLCKDMFDAAHNMLINRHDFVSITLFDDMLISSDIFNQISIDISKIYRPFWDNRPKDDNMLTVIYNHIIFDKPHIKDEIDGFFSKNPDDVFEIWDFGYKYGYIIGTQEKFIVRKFDKSKSIICRDLNTDTDVLCLTKQQYERMLQVVSELKDYSKQHPFDITKYIKGN